MDVDIHLCNRIYPSALKGKYLKLFLFLFCQLHTFWPTFDLLGSVMLFLSDQQTKVLKPLELREPVFSWIDFSLIVGCSLFKFSKKIPSPIFENQIHKVRQFSLLEFLPSARMYKRPSFYRRALRDRYWSLIVSRSLLIGEFFNGTIYCTVV